MKDRREVLTAGMGMALAPLTLGCSKATGAVAGAGYEMPLESEPHLRTFMQWPASLDVYDRRGLARVQDAIAHIANTIVQYEPVVMLAAPQDMAGARKALSGEIAIWDVPTDDLWCRDSGPTFVRNATGALAVAHIAFNGWGNKQPHANDRLIAPKVAERLGLPLLDTGLVGEQGGVEHDGAGTLLAHASCWANPNRNRLSQTEIGDRLLAALGGEQMIWAPGITGQDITDYHIDALARFVGPGKVLIQLGAQIDPDDPWSVSGHETLRILEQSRDAAGRPLEIIRLPDPVDIRSRKADFVASYVNFYVCNGAVIAAQFGDRKADAAARDLLQSLYPGRVVELLDVDALGEVGGGIHCATQQQPVGEAA
jgi:agmatine deiminase